EQVDTAMLISAGALPGYIQSGKLKALGVTGTRRLESLPGVPTFDEMPGLKGYTMVAWTGIFAPARTPAPIVARINQELNAVLNEAEIRAKLQDQGALPGSGSAEDLGRFAQAEYARNQKVVQGVNFKE
ncbi:MAG: tripartite tricarboxylate transporter substrate-binding protein, partial [Burkholderiaceae bacterium]